MELPIKIQLPNNFLEEEIRCGYTVSSKIKAVWAVELDLYKELERVCDKYGLTVYADGGTMIGAARHEGFIPWDDDIDLAMSRQDYEKLCAVADKEFEHPYFFQTEKTNPGIVRGHAQLRNSLTTAINMNDVDLDINQGIFIDIFPYDNVPDESNERHKFLKEILSLEKEAKRYRDYYKGLNKSEGLIKALKEVYLYFFMKIHRDYNNKQYIALEEFKQKYNSVETDLWSNVAIILKDKIDRGVVKKEYYRKTIDMKFEFITLKVPSMYDEYLTKLYGNWKKFVIGNNVHGQLIFDPYEPFTKYVKSNK